MTVIVLLYTSAYDTYQQFVGVFSSLDEAATWTTKHPLEWTEAVQTQVDNSDVWDNVTDELRALSQRRVQEEKQ